MNKNIISKITLLTWWLFYCCSMSLRISSCFSFILLLLLRGTRHESFAKIRLITIARALITRTERLRGTLRSTLIALTMHTLFYIAMGKMPKITIARNTRYRKIARTNSRNVQESRRVIYFPVFAARNDTMMHTKYVTIPARSNNNKVYVLRM